MPESKSDSPADAVPENSTPTYTKRYSQYVLGVLLVVYIFNFVDRQILAILAQSIKTDLGLTDTQIGLLSGLAFGIFYATLGIPIARLADRYSRVNIISICLAIWSAMTALSGLAGNFWQLLLARIGVGIGEAGGSPPSHSLLADYFPVNERATALGIYAIGIPVGILFGNLAGGWINEYFGWRNAFLVVGHTRRPAGHRHEAHGQGTAAGTLGRPPGSPGAGALHRRHPDHVGLQELPADLARCRHPGIRRLRRHRLDACLPDPHPRHELR